MIFWLLDCVGFSEIDIMLVARVLLQYIVFENVLECCYAQLGCLLQKCNVFSIFTLPDAQEKNWDIKEIDLVSFFFFPTGWTSGQTGQQISISK